LLLSLLQNFVNTTSGISFAISFLEPPALTIVTGMVPMS